MALQKAIFGLSFIFAFKPFGSSLFEIQIMPYSSLAPSFLSYFNPTYFISITAHLYSHFDFYTPNGNFNFILVLVLKFPGSLNFLFHNLSSHQFSRKNTSLAQFIPRIYNKIIIKILGYFWGVRILPHLRKFRPRNSYYALYLFYIKSFMFVSFTYDLSYTSFSFLFSMSCLYHIVDIYT